MTILDGADRTFWDTTTFRLIRTWCTFVNGDVDENVLAGLIAEASVKVDSQLTKKGNKYCGIVFCAGISGEPITCPHIRQCALNEEYLKKLTNGTLKGRSGLGTAGWDECASIAETDIWVFADGGCQGDPTPYE